MYKVTLNVVWLWGIVQLFETHLKWPVKMPLIHKDQLHFIK